MVMTDLTEVWVSRVLVLSIRFTDVRGVPLAFQDVDVIIFQSAAADYANFQLSIFSLFVNVTSNIYASVPLNAKYRSQCSMV